MTIYVHHFIMVHSPLTKVVIRAMSQGNLTQIAQILCLEAVSKIVLSTTVFY